MDTSPESPPAPYLADLLPLANRAFAHTSHTPDRRAKDTIASHSKELLEDLALVRNISPSETDFHVKLYEEQYRKYFSDWLTAHSNCVSTLVAGGSKFNHKRANKANNREQGRLNAFLQWRSRAMAKIQHDVAGPRTPETELEKVTNQLNKRERTQTFMKAANAALRGKEPRQKLLDLGVGEKHIEGFIAKKGFPDWELSNNNAQIRRLKKRVEELSTKTSRQGLGVKLLVEFDTTPLDDEAKGEAVVHYGLDRVQIHFEGKPNEELRINLRKHGFKWAPSQSAWQRQLTDAGIAAVGAVLNQHQAVVDFSHDPVPTELHQLVPLAAAALPKAWEPHKNECVGRDMPGAVLDVIQGALLYCGSGASTITPELLEAGHHLVGALPDADGAPRYGINPQLVSTLASVVQHEQELLDEDF